MPGHHVVDVRARRIDRAAEDEREQQHEHHRQHDRHRAATRRRGASGGGSGVTKTLSAVSPEMRGRMPGTAGASVVMRSPSRWMRSARRPPAEVRARNTSSRLGRRRVTTPSAPDSSRTSSAPAEAGDGAVRGHLGSRSPCGSCSSTVSPPMRAFSCAAVPIATTRPPSRTAMRSASWSASSRYCVVRKTVVPASRERADGVPQLASAAGVQARRGFVEEEDLGCDDEAQREVEPAAHAAGVRADALVGGIREIEAVEQLGRARPRRRNARARRAGRA